MKPGDGQPQPDLLLQPAPFLRQGVTTRGLMVDVVIAMAPVVLAAIYFFGLSALLILASAVAGCVLTEQLASRAMNQRGSLKDGSAILTGVILGLTLPPSMPMWMAFLGGVAAIGLGKAIFGGLGQNLFNPALVGRAFLQAAFPTAITTWVAHGDYTGLLSARASNFAWPFMQAPDVDAVTTATPLGLWKFEGAPTPLQDLVLGSTAGSLGETSGLLIILGGIYLVARRSMDWRIPVAVLLSTFVFAGLFWLIDGDRYPTPWFMLFSGSVLFGAVYMASDPVTSPIAPLGAWIFGIGIGLLVVLIRLWGGLPEGVMYAILLMNAATPLIERITQPRGFGREAFAR
jgi:electron transport complex protein RnfD